ncbi:DNA adenine methylase [Brevundimonas sp. P7753]|uniref:DNA adenine methylase n=1 Tax=Brevundimonas sp. P7753 TaxID=2726982 RepID=UPI0015B908BB|nr:DNA adenine methylase [Brevundimonas sp. P7753]NWE54092.1 DNA adenine methylase [Brevundimonas sp. P7753]
MFSTSHTPVSTVRPVAPWIGGKRNLARRLCALIEATPHDLYAEPFVGMGGVFFRRRRRPKCEMINDYSGEVANLFRCMRAHAGPLTELTAWTFSSRDEFDRLRRVDPTTLTDLQRAARFIFLQRLAFGGKVRGQSFGVRTDGPARYRSSQVSEDLLAAARRLEAVTIENLDWSAFVARYDRPGALFYMDPPYFACEGDYGDGLFNRDQFGAMAEQLAGLKGRFILSLNDRPEVREIFAAFDIEEVSTHYGLAGRGSQVAREVIITGR